MSIRPAVLVLPLLALLAPALPAADQATTDFKKAAKVRVKEAAEAIEVAGDSLVVAFASAAQSFAADDLLAEEALAAAVSSVVAARDTMEDGALEAASALSADGQQALLLHGVTEPGADFAAGGQGVWDDALADIDEALADADERLREDWAGFAAALDVAAAEHAAAIDLRVQLPPHSRHFRSVAPPSAVPAGGGPGEIAAAAPQILIALRVLASTSVTELTIVGVRAATESVDVRGASTAADEAVLGPLEPNEAGTAIGAFALVTLAHPQGFVVLHVDDGSVTSPAATLSAPTTVAASPDIDEVLAVFEQSFKPARKTLLKAASAAGKQLKQALAAQKKAVKKGEATPEQALRDGFASLRDAREAVGLAWLDYAAATSGAASAALAGAAADDAALPADFQPDAPGLAADGHALTLKKLGSKQSQLGNSFAKFSGKLLKQAQKGGAAVAANVVVGQGAGFAAPMISGAATPPFASFIATGLTDGLTLGVGASPATISSLLVNVQADPAGVPTLSISAAAYGSGTLTNLGDLSIQPGGTQMQEFGLSADGSPTGWLFNGGPTTTDQGSPMVISAPAVPATAP